MFRKLNVQHTCHLISFVCFRSASDMMDNGIKIRPFAIPIFDWMEA